MMHLNRKEQALILAIGANVCLIALKFYLAWCSGSLALKAGAWHSFSDIIVSCIVLTGLIFSRKENLELSNGISRIENAVALVVGLSILYVGWDILQDVIIGGKESLTNVPVVIGGALLTTVASYLIARFKIFVGRETNSPSLIADGFHSKLDMYSSIVVIAGLVGYQIGLSSMDKVAAVAVVVLVAWTGVDIVFGALRALRSGGLPDILQGSFILCNFDKYGQHISLLGTMMLFLFYVLSGVYTIESNQKGIVKVFGKPTESQVNPGIHYRLPWPISTVDIVEVDTIRIATMPKSLMLTGDENLIEVEATAHYSVQDVFNFTYRFSDPQSMMSLAVESVVRQIISRYPVDAVLTDKKGDIQKEALTTVQMTLDKSKVGIRLVALQLTKASPPAEVLPAFQDVASAREDQVTYLNEAYAYKNEIIPVSRGKAAEISASSEAYREDKISSSRGDAAAFLSRLLAFNENREITRTRLYIETMERVLPKVQKMIVDKRIDIKSTDLWMFNGRLDGGPFKKGDQK